MIVYRPWGVDGYQRVLLVNDDDYRPMGEKLAAEPGRPVGSRWSPLWVWLNAEKQGVPRRHADLPWFPGGDVLTVNRRARIVLEPIVSGDAEFLPLECEDDELWFMHAWRSVPALDLERATVKLYSSGRIMDVTKYEFAENKIRGLTCFTDPRIGVKMFVTDEVASAAQQAGLAGTWFKPLWRGPGDFMAGCG